VRRNYYHDYKFLEGVLEWYFGSRVSLNYRYLPNNSPTSSPLVTINGEIVAQGRIPANQIIEHIENMGIDREGQ